MDKEEFLQLIGNDELGILKSKPEAFGQSGEERLVEKFQEINEFIRMTGKEPEANRKNLKEMELFSRLRGLRQDHSKMSRLKPYDEFNLFADIKAVETIEDILKTDELGILNDAEDIFTLKHIPATKTVNTPDFVAQRSPCRDFADFEPLFLKCHDELRKELRTMMPFKRGSLIAKGDFFVLNGVLVYVAEEGEKIQTADKNTFNARLRCIFENGTESNLLLRSLAAALYKEDGRRVSTSTDALFERANQVNEDDTEAGTLYILKSLSGNPKIRTIKNLYKIGFTRGSTELRIKNASSDPTYLMAPVSIVSTFTCYNLNAQKLEYLLHTFFKSVALDIEMTDKKGRPYLPKEWFVAPLAVIEHAIELLRSNEILEYRYNPETQLIDRKKN